MSNRRYRDIAQDPRELRPRKANQMAALGLVAFLVVIIAVVALFG